VAREHLLQQPGLADPGLALDQHHHRWPGQRLAQRRQFFPAPDELRRGDRHWPVDNVVYGFFGNCGPGHNLLP
jgi:hypothetical protein